MDKILNKQLYYRTKGYENYEKITNDYLTDRYNPLFPIYVICKTKGNEIKYIEPITGFKITIISSDLKKAKQGQNEKIQKEKINACSYGIMINQSSHYLTSKINYEKYCNYLNNPLKAIINSKINYQHLKEYLIQHGQEELLIKLEYLDEHNSCQLFKEIIKKYLEIESNLSQDYQKTFRSHKAKRKVLKH